MISLRIVLLAVATALLGCAASPAPVVPPAAPRAPAAPSSAPAAPPEFTGVGAAKVDTEGVPGQLPSRADRTGGAGPDQATIVAETKRLRDRSRSCVTVAGELRTGRVFVTIASTGYPDRVVVKGHLEGTPEGTCVASKFRDFHIRPFVGAPVTIRMSISIP